MSKTKLTMTEDEFNKWTKGFRQTDNNLECSTWPVDGNPNDVIVEVKFKYRVKIVDNPQPLPLDSQGEQAYTLSK